MWRPATAARWLPRCLQEVAARGASTAGRRPQEVFDRRAKLLQRERAAASAEVDRFDFLKEEVGYRVADRVLDVARRMEVAVDLGSGRGWVTRHLMEESVGRLTAIELSPGLLEQAPLPEGIDVQRLAMDMDGGELPFADDSVDLVTSCLAMHWVNDLPGVFREVQRVLKPDGVFIGAMFGGDTLVELRVALQLAQLEREGGLAPRVSPFVTVQDLGSLLSGAGLTMLTIDTDDLKVRYPTILPLLGDLRGMGETSAAINRQLHLHRETLLAANAVYGDLYGEQGGEGQEDMVLPATFQVYYWIGWNPDPTQPRALKPQKSDVSLQDLYRLDEIAEQKGVVDIGTDPKD